MVDALVNGEPCNVVPLDDRGLLYGDHLFETVAFVCGRAPLWDRHMARLARDARRLLMPEVDPDLLAAECARLVDGQRRAVVRITLTRGSGGRAYEPPDAPRPRRILARRPWSATIDQVRTEGIVLHTSPVRLSVGRELAGIKHGNRLEQVLAAEHARRAGVDEAVLFDVDGRLVEAIAGNLVLLIDGKAVTPRLAGSGVAGVGLEWLGERLGSDLATRELDAENLRRAESAMVINSVAGIRPVRKLDDRALEISETCRRWQRLWDELFECED
ncbi:aminodeoxychorismate lyase [Wenzhouxiangella sp. EGI_FJ10305]|uniref:aminodeoxychorismate lyase n=1 Tax=Wenzhouxiangella sp. EGI_FJ10305 TaxID=3243768 RepID=UPI0035DF4C80